MKNTTKQKILHNQPSDKTLWAYHMQAIEPKSEKINEAFPGYHPQWVQMSQRYTIAAESFKGLRLTLGMTVEQCAAYLRVSCVTITRWESGKTPVPFAELEVLRLVSESVRFSMTHPDWDGWFINDHGVLHSPIIGGHGFTPEQLAWSTMTRSEAALLRNDVARLQTKLDAAIAENTNLRQMYLDNGITDEVASMQEKVNGLMARINTARVFKFTVIEDKPLLEKIA